MNLSIAIVDDDRHACLRLKGLLQHHCNLDAHFFQTNPVLAEQEILTQSIDILFLDVEMPQMFGLELWQNLKEKGFAGRVVFTTAFNQYVLDALRAEAFDYLLKPVEEQDLMAVLNRFENTKINATKDFEKLSAKGLTKREIEISKLIFNGLSSHDIGEQLFISKKTVDKHRSNILHKTGCKNTTELFTLL